MISGIKNNLLSTQALKIQGVVNWQKLHEYEFFGKNNKIIAKGSYVEKFNYLTWIREPEALYGENSKEFAYKFTEKFNVVSADILHQKLRHPEVDWLTYLQNAVQDMEITGIEELPEDCEMCKKAKMMKLQ